MELSLFDLLELLGVSADDMSIDKRGQISFEVPKDVCDKLFDMSEEEEEDEVDCDCDCDCACCDDYDCDCDYDCEEEDEEDCDCDFDFSRPELAETYAREILMAERDRAKELGEQNAYDALNFAVNVLLHQQAMDIGWLENVYDNVME